MYVKRGERRKNNRISSGMLTIYDTSSKLKYKNSQKESIYIYTCMHKNWNAILETWNLVKSVCKAYVGKTGRSRSMWAISNLVTSVVPK